MAKRIDSYIPQMDPEYWEVIEDFVRAIITDAAPDRWSTGRPWLSNIAGLALWCWQSQGLELDREKVLSHGTICRYVNSRTDWNEASRATTRANLLRVSERVGVLRESTRDHRRLGNSKGRIPYSREEIIALRSFAYGQATPYRRRNLRTILVLGAGGGLSASEMLIVRPENFETVDGYTLNLEGDRPRSIPILAEWDDLLAESMAEAQAAGPLLSSSKGEFLYANAIPDFLNSCNGIGLRPHSQRLRSTWLVAHLNACTPLDLLLEAAGLTGMSALDRYLKYVSPTPAESKTGLLRLEGRR